MGREGEGGTYQIKKKNMDMGYYEVSNKRISRGPEGSARDITRSQMHA